MAKLIKASSTVFLILIIVVILGVNSAKAKLPEDDEGGPSPPISEAAKKICPPPFPYYFMCYRFLANVSGVPDKSALPALAAAGLEAEANKEGENIERELKDMPDKYGDEANCMKTCQGFILDIGSKAKELAAASDFTGLLAFLNGTSSGPGGACDSQAWDLCCHNKCRPNDSGYRQLDPLDVQMAVPAACGLVGLALNNTYSIPH